MIAKLAKAVVVAFIFLTRLPMPRLAHISPEDNGRSLCAFPLVGLVIGLLLFIAASVLTWVLPVMVVATLLLTLWVLLTGGLHLDGLADSADAWLGGYGDKARTLEIMKDPRCGSAAVMTVALLLLVKFAGLYALLETGQLAWLVVPPLIGRSGTVLLMLTTPYARAQGLGSDYLAHMPRLALWLILVIVGLLTWLALPGATAGIVLVSSLLVTFLLRRLMLKRLDGTTGDTAGALLEILEATALIALVVHLH